MDSHDAWHMVKTGLSLVNEINEVFCDNFIAVTVSSSSNAVYKMKMIIYIQMCPVNALSLNKLLICMKSSLYSILPARILLMCK